MKRKYSPLHDFWHKRVEGQIKHTMNMHPKWFTFKDDIDKNTCINSLAKRIVGEIVAVVRMVTLPKENHSLVNSDDDSILSLEGDEMVAPVSSPNNLQG